MVSAPAIRLDQERRVGEVGLNAVHPDQAGQGIGTGLEQQDTRTDPVALRR